MKTTMKRELETITETAPLNKHRIAVVDLSNHHNRENEIKL